MSEAKHTPGPWHMGRKGNECRIYADRDQHAIARTYGTGLNGIGVCELTGPENKADAILIAAAPELLEALVALLPHVPGHMTNNLHGRPWIEQARAAIAKATNQ